MAYTCHGNGSRPRRLEENGRESEAKSWKESSRRLDTGFFSERKLSRVTLRIRLQSPRRRLRTRLEWRAYPRMRLEPSRQAPNRNRMRLERSHVTSPHSSEWDRMSSSPILRERAIQACRESAS